MNTYLNHMSLGAASLSMIIFALLSEHLFGFAPCSLCLIQRYPHIIVVIISLDTEQNLNPVSKTSKFLVFLKIPAVSFKVSRFLFKVCDFGRKFSDFRRDFVDFF